MLGTFLHFYLIKITISHIKHYRHGKKRIYLFTLTDHDIIDIGGREIEVLHTPGHSPGHLCFWEKSKGYLFTGDLVYKDILFAYYPSADPEAYLDSMEKVAAWPVKKVFPAHHLLDIQPEILIRMRETFRNLKAAGKLHHGSGTFPLWRLGRMAVKSSPEK